MKKVLRDIGLFFKGHWPHVVVAIPAAIAFTALHELAHCAAVWMQGGTVTEFVWLPSGAEWGHMQYAFPPGVEYSEAVISLSPYVFWVASCVVAGVLSLKPTRWPFWFASTIFVWLFIVPLADIANTAAPYLILDASNDFRYALGPAPSSFAILAAVPVAVAVLYGYLLNRRLYRDRAIGFPAYCILAGTAALMVLALTSVRFG